jgi:hypothetical protein
VRCEGEGTARWDVGPKIPDFRWCGSGERLQLYAIGCAGLGWEQNSLIYARDEAAPLLGAARLHGEDHAELGFAA